MSNLKKIALVTALLILPLFITTLLAQKKIDLSYNLEQGTTFEIVTAIDQDIVFEANGQPMTLDQKLIFKSSTIVESVEKDSISLRTTIDAIRMEQSIFGMEIIYDSEDTKTTENPMAEEVGKAMGKILGETMSTLIDKKGNVLKYDLGGLASNSEMANNISSGNSNTVFPENKISVGDFWEADITPMKNSDMKSHTKYTLVKITKKTVTIEILSTITANDIEGEDIKMQGVIEGEIIVERKTGWTIQSDLDMETALELEQNGMKFPATISSTINVISSAKE